MNKLYTIYSKNFLPISYQGEYLYETYDRITSFLGGKISEDEKKRLLKPILVGDEIDWYGEFSGEFKRITDHSQLVAERVKSEFDEFIKKMSKISEELLIKKDEDNKEWGKLTNALFQHEKIILLINNGGEWAMLWGWDFQSNDENLIPAASPLINEPSKIGDENENSINVSIDGNTRPIITGTGQDTLGTNTSNGSTSDNNDNEEDEEEDFEQNPIIKESLKSRVGCLGRIKRFFRWVSYRFWGLFWFIIYTLLIIWLCHYCNKPNCDVCCDKLDEAEKELNKLNERVRDRCDTTYQRN